MCTELEKIKASIEIPKPESRTSDYKSTEVYITRFWGGDERRLSVQLAFSNEIGRMEHMLETIG